MRVNITFKASPTRAYVYHNVIETRKESGFYDMLFEKGRSYAIALSEIRTIEVENE